MVAREEMPTTLAQIRFVEDLKMEICMQEAWWGTLMDLIPMASERGRGW